MARQRDSLFHSLMRAGAAEFFSSLIGVGRFLGQAFRATAQRFFGRSENLTPPQTRALNRVAKVAQQMPVGAGDLERMTRRDRQKAIPTQRDPTIASNYLYVFTVTIHCPGQPDIVSENVIGNPYKMSIDNLQRIVQRDRQKYLEYEGVNLPNMGEDCTLTVTSVRRAYNKN